MSNGNGTPDIGPGELAPEGNNPFLLSKPEFLAVQTYVEAGKFLPKSAGEMQSKLGIPSGDATRDLQDLIDIYSQIVTHCAYFSATTFPMSVELAGDIVHYNEKVPIYYGALNPIIDAWNDGMLPEDKAQQKLSAVLGVLRDAAQGYANRAATVKGKIHDFVEETKGDKAVLDPLDQRYEQEYTGQDGRIVTYMNQLKDAKDNIKKWNDEYTHDVTVAATSATYAWIFPAGTIAAAVVAGVYGKQATDDLDKVHEYEDKLAAAEENLRKALNTMHALKLANASLDGILEQLNAALPVLEKMEGIWGAIADDLSNIINVIDTGIDQAIPIIKDLGVANAITSWANVAILAQGYRLNAYITVKTEDEIKQEAAADPEKYAVPQAA